MKKILILALISLTISFNLRFATSPQDAKKDIKGFENVELLSKAAENIASGWKSIVGAFKTTSSKTIEKVTDGKGYNYFKGKFNIWVCEGLKEKYYDDFFSKKALRLKMPKDKREVFVDAIQDGKMMDKHTWTNMEILFNVDGKEKGTVKGINLIINQPSETKFDALITDIDADFKLAPDIFVEQTSRSILGGIFEGTKSKFITKPRNISDKEILDVLNFYKLLGYKVLCEIFGINIKLPF